VLEDLRLAARSLLRRKEFLAVAVLTLALGVGANGTIYSVVDGVLLQPLPYQSPDRLALLWHEFGDGAQNLPALHPADLRDYAARSRLFEEFAIATGGERILGGQQAEPELVDVGQVSANFFEFLGIAPALGRSFRAEEDVAAGPRVALLSDRLWRRRFGSDANVVGRRFDLDGESHEIVGVLPAAFRLLLPAEAFRLKDSELWVPAQIDYARLPPRNYTGFTGFARLREGVSFASAQEEMNALAAQLRREQPVHAASNLRVSVVPLQHDIVKGARRGLVLLMAAVGFVLLIACANVAQLLLTRGRARERELLVRVAVGATRWRMARLVLAEGLFTAACGAALGVPLVWGGLGLVRSLASASVPRVESIGVGLEALAFLALAALLSTLLFALLPALQAARADVAAGLKEAAVRSASLRQTRMRDIIVGVQVALSLVLVVGAGLMVRSFTALAQVRPGFDPKRALTLRVSLPPNDFRDAAVIRAFYRNLERGLLGLPGVREVAAVSLLPLAGSGPLQPYAYDDRTRRNWESVSADHRWVTPHFFAAIGATLLSGRDFVPSDLEDGRPRIIIDDTLAARAFAGRDPVGQSLQIEPDGTEGRFAEVVGVVAHIKLHDLTRPMLPQIYSPGVASRFSLVIRGGDGVTELASRVRHELAALNPAAAVESVRTLEEIVSGAMGQTRLAVTLMSAFGTLAILLAAVGIYGVFSYSVAQRTREIAIRMALGEAPAGIRRLVLGKCLRLVGASVLLGLCGAAWLSRYVAALLYGVNPLDPPTYLASTLFLAAVGLLASWLPAGRAARVAPLTALRQE